MLKMLIAVDDAPAAARAIEAVARMARAGAPIEVTLLDVHGARPGAGRSPPSSRPDHVLADAEARVLGCGLALRATVRGEGPAAQEIMRVADARAVDQIVLGLPDPPDAGGPAAAPLALRLLALTERPLLLVR